MLDRQYKKLSKIRPAENMEEKEIEGKVDNKCQEIIAEEKTHQEIITTTEIRKAVKGMKNKIVGDKNNWKAQWIKKGGDEMVKCSNSIPQRREENFNTIEGNKSKVIIQRRKQREDAGKSKKDISDERSV